MPFFDLENADVVLSFGANFLETWLSPVAFTRGFAKMRRGNPERRGYFVHFEPRMSQTASKADLWVPLRPGTEGLVALAIGKLVAEAKGGAIPTAFSSVDPLAVAEESGVELALLQQVAQVFVNAHHPLAIPGGAALGQSNGLATAESVLALNAQMGNFGLPGGVFVSPLAPAQNEYHRPASAQEMTDFIAKMNNGGVKVLFIHGINPVFELPKHLGFAEALESVPQVISFATFPDETALAADYIFPDHHGLESWGYQRAVVSAKPILSGAQPVVAPYFNTRSTADVFLAAAPESLPFADEVAFIQNKLARSGRRGRLLHCPGDQLLYRLLPTARRLVDRGPGVVNAFSSLRACETIEPWHCGICRRRRILLPAVRFADAW